MPPQDSFDATAFLRGLQALSYGIRTSPILQPYMPIEFVASGGFVSVMHLHNRTASHDLDYFLHPTVFGGQRNTVRSELSRIITEVANRLNFVNDWANDNVTVFLGLLNDPVALFERSKRQNIIIFQDQSIRVFAVLWEWVLVRKLKRLQMEGQPQRREDWNDCVAICGLLNQQRPEVLNWSMLRQFDNTQREPPVLSNTVAQLGRLLTRFININPFATASEVEATEDEAEESDEDESDEDESDEDEADEDEADEDESEEDEGGESNSNNEHSRLVEQAVRRRDLLMRQGASRSMANNGLVPLLAAAAGISIDRAQRLLSNAP